MRTSESVEASSSASALRLGWRLSYEAWMLRLGFGGSYQSEVRFDDPFWRSSQEVATGSLIMGAPRVIRLRFGDTRHDVMSLGFEARFVLPRGNGGLQRAGHDILIDLCAWRVTSLVDPGEEMCFIALNSSLFNSSQAHAVDGEASQRWLKGLQISAGYLHLFQLERMRVNERLTWSARLGGARLDPLYYYETLVDYSDLSEEGTTRTLEHSRTGDGLIVPSLSAGVSFDHGDGELSATASTWSRIDATGTAADFGAHLEINHRLYLTPTLQLISNAHVVGARREVVSELGDAAALALQEGETFAQGRVESGLEWSLPLGARASAGLWLEYSDRLDPIARPSADLGPMLWAGGQLGVAWGVGSAPAR